MSCPTCEETRQMQFNNCHTSCGCNSAYPPTPACEPPKCQNNKFLNECGVFTNFVGENGVYLFYDEVNVRQVKEGTMRFSLNLCEVAEEPVLNLGQTQVILTKNVLKGTLVKVFANGVKLKNSEYTVNGNIVYFKNALDTSVNYEFIYFAS